MPSHDVFIVDDDAAVSDALSLILILEGFETQCFLDIASFLEAVRTHTPACVLLDVHMPERSGLDVLRELHSRHFPAPLIVISGQGDIPMAVDAIKHGAFDFIEKPFDSTTLVERVKQAVSRRLHDGEGLASLCKSHFSGSDLLTPREWDVLYHIADGASNKEAGRRLGISPRTIEVHRARIMDKIGAKNAADLIRIVVSDRV